ncbi:hypothetical protein VG1_CDS0031 [Arthrobacter phage Cupello]|nr:hypothetical protein VG1_CDS0031 [Arthrobacter phage Cupello]
MERRPDDPALPSAAGRPLLPQVRNRGRAPHKPRQAPPGNSDLPEHQDQDHPQRPQVRVADRGPLVARRGSRGEPLPALPARRRDRPQDGRGLGPRGRGLRPRRLNTHRHPILTPTKGTTMNNSHPGLSTWYTLGERGASSNALASYLSGGPLPPGFNDPADPSDFRRCELLLRAVPTLRDELPRMATVSDRWAGLVQKWDEIAALMEEEVPGVFSGRKLHPRATSPKAYALMRSITGPNILLEEVFEATAEEDPATLRKELVQVAAVTAQWIEAIDRRARNVSEG